MSKFYKNYIQLNDVRLFYKINQKIKYTLFDKLMHLISRIFDADVYTFIIAVIFLVMIRFKLEYKKALLLFSISQIITYLAKRTFARKRPFMVLDKANLAIKPPKDQYSFPSGHTNAAVTLALIMMMCLPYLAPVFIILAVLCGLSRIYLGVHYPSDVLIGALVPIVTQVIL